MIRKNYLGIDNNFLPFLRRFLIVLRPLEVDIRVRKPESFKIEYLLLLESVFFDIL